MYLVTWCLVIEYLCYNMAMTYLLEAIRSYDFDVYYFLYSRGLHSDFLFDFYLLFAKYGIAFFLLSFTYLIWMKRINAFICSFIAMGLAGLTDLVIFVLWQRPRPFVAHPNITVPQLGQLDVGRMSSFPSSHTYIVFAIATSIFLYGHRRLGALLFILAVCVAVSRVGTGLHYPSDTIAGAVLGILSGVLSYRFVRENEHRWEYAS